MSFSELLLTLIVTLIVFGPKKLPLLAHHLGKLFAIMSRYKQQVLALWQQQLQAQQLLENQKKAATADEHYEKR